MSSIMCIKEQNWFFLNIELWLYPGGSNLIPAFYIMTAPNLVGSDHRSGSWVVDSYMDVPIHSIVTDGTGTPRLCENVIDLDPNLTVELDENFNVMVVPGIPYGELQADKHLMVYPQFGLVYLRFDEPILTKGVVMFRYSGTIQHSVNNLLPRQGGPSS